MSSLFLTDPDNPHKPHRTLKTKRGYFDFKEGVEAELMNLGIPFEDARVAVIDFKSDIYVHFNNKLTTRQAAVMIIDDVRRIYKI